MRVYINFISMLELAPQEGSVISDLNTYGGHPINVESSWSNHNSQVFICCALVIVLILKTSIIIYSKFNRYLTSIRSNSDNSRNNNIVHHAY